MFVAIANSDFLFETTEESHGLSPWSPLTCFFLRGNAGMALKNVTDSETWRVNPCGQNPWKTEGKQTAFFLSIFLGRSTYEFPYHLTLMMAIHPTRFFRVWMSISDSYTHGVFIWVGTLQSVTLWYSIGTPPIQRWQTMITFWLFSRSYRRSPFFIGRSW